MNFALFLLLNAVLLLRPDDLFPELAGLRLYFLVIVPCTLASLPQLQEQLSARSLQRRPVAVCVLLIFFSALLSLFVQGRISEALFDFGPEFAKVVLYFFLLLAVIDTHARFRAFAAALVVLIGCVAAIALANHYGVMNIPSIEPAMQRMHNEETGEEYFIPRLVSCGVFNDPNDLCLVLGLGILCCIYSATQGPSRIVGLLWLLPIPLFIYAILETYSRGGLLGVLVGLASYIFSRFGGPKSLPFAIGGAMAVLSLVGGRQGNISGGGTAHERLMYWAEGMTTIGRHPLLIPTGLGRGWFQEETGHVAHNSFVTAYIEFGVFGGGAFLGAFFLSARLLYLFDRGISVPSWVSASKHFAFAVVVGYAMGCYSLSRNFVLSTYLVLGLASVLLEQAAPSLPKGDRVTRRWFAWGLLFAIAGFVFFKFMTQVMGEAGI